MRTWQPREALLAAHAARLRGSAALASDRIAHSARTLQLASPDELIHAYFAAVAESRRHALDMLAVATHDGQSNGVEANITTA